MVKRESLFGHTGRCFGTTRLSGIGAYRELCVRFNIKTLGPLRGSTYKYSTIIEDVNHVTFLCHSDLANSMTLLIRIFQKILDLRQRALLCRICHSICRDDEVSLAPFLAGNEAGISLKH